MSKAVYFEQAAQQLNTTITVDQSAIIMQLCKKPFVSIDDLASSIVLPKDKLEEGIEQLIDSELVEDSAGLFSTSPLGDELVDIAAQLYVQENKPELLEAKNKRKPRGVTEDMTKTADWVKEQVETKHEVKDIRIDRSNYHVRLAKRTPCGIRQFEVLNNGMFRVFGYKMTKENIEKFLAIGMTHRIGGNNVYIDIECTEENVLKIVELI